MLTKLVRMIERWPRWARMLFGWLSIGGSFFVLALNGIIFGLPEIWQYFCLLAGFVGCVIFTMAFWTEAESEIG